ncbi:MAG: T9SS type A sorting domain-containing protein [Caldithrix sp.]|nr:T9SS type A sorting domain-containing protein [Caldithrix sp.]
MIIDEYVYTKTFRTKLKENKMIRALCIAIFLIQFGLGDIIKHQSFEDGTDNWNYTPTPEAFTDGEDVWNIVDNSWQNADLTTMPSDGSFFWGVQDLNSPMGTSDFGHLSFDSVHVTGYTNVTISFDYDVFEFDTGDDIKYEVFFDGVGQGEVLLIDGDSNYSTSGTETINVSTGIDSIRLIIYVKQNGGGDYAGLDNILVQGVKEGGNTTVQFAQSEDTVNEGDGSYNLLVTIINPDPQNATTADVELSNGDPADVDNYTTQQVTFPAGSSENQTVTIGITDDGEYEGSEIITFNLTNVQGGNNAQAGVPDQFELTITDNDPPPVPDIVINEIMQNPSAVGDTDGEWFELFNTSDSDIDINGWKIADLGSDEHIIDNGGPLTIASNDYLVLGRNGDTGTNGGVTVDYVYSSFLLSNSEDEVILYQSDGTTEIDRVEYDGGASFPNPNGASMELNNPQNDNNDGSNWSEATTSFGDGDFGTPGSQNSTFVSTITIENQFKVKSYKLHPNYPNPFNPITTISFDLNKNVSHIELKIYDILGKNVRTIHEGTLNAGHHTMHWNGKNEAGMLMPSGVYYAVLETLYFSDTIKMMLVK